MSKTRLNISIAICSLVNGNKLTSLITPNDLSLEGKQRTKGHSFSLKHDRVLR